MDPRHPRGEGLRVEGAGLVEVGGEVVEAVRAGARGDGRPGPRVLPRGEARVRHRAARRRDAEHRAEVGRVGALAVLGDQPLDVLLRHLADGARGRPPLGDARGDGHSRASRKPRLPDGLELAAERRHDANARHDHAARHASPP